MTAIPEDKIGPNGIVDVWDKGPPEGAPDREDWQKQNGGAPVPLKMHYSDAGHALTVEPDRYTLEPPEDAAPLVPPVTDQVPPEVTPEEPEDEPHSSSRRSKGRR